ncbi:MAG: hypothetical protein ACOY0T_19130 [Myxococcota bacterium]
MRVRPLLVCVAWLATASFLPRPALAEDAESDEGAAEEEKKSEDEEAPAKNKRDAESNQGARAANNVGSGSIGLTMTSTLASYSQLSFVIQPKNQADMSGTLTNTAWGLSTNSVTLEAVYGLSNHALLGFLLELGGSTLATKIETLGIDEELQMARFLVGPKFEYLFSNSGTVRPFVQGVTGFTWAPQQNTNQSISLTGFQALAGFGLHWHITPNFSIDPQFRAGGGIGWGRINQGEYRNVPAHGSLLTAGLVLGATGWIL